MFGKCEIFSEITVYCGDIIVSVLLFISLGISVLFNLIFSTIYSDLNKFEDIVENFLVDPKLVIFNSLF